MATIVNYKKTYTNEEEDGYLLRTRNLEFILKIYNFAKI